MAIFHFSASVLSRSKGQSAVASAAYQSAAEIVDERTGEVKNYSRKERVNHSEIQAPENAPEWVHNRARLWNEVETSEKRKDSQLARKVNLALPRELNPEEQRELMRRYVQSQFVSRGQIVDWSIHDSQGENPHAHLMMTTREIGPEGFGQKRRDWNPEFKGKGFAQGAALVDERAAWADQCNRALREAGHEASIDHRSLEAQGVERVPQIHLGPNPGPARREEAQDRREVNQLLSANRAELERAQAELREITATLEAKARKPEAAQERRSELLQDKASDPIQGFEETPGRGNQVEPEAKAGPSAERNRVHQVEPEEAQKRPQEAAATFESPTPGPEAQEQPEAQKRPQEAQEEKLSRGQIEREAEREKRRADGLRVWPEAERVKWRAERRPEAQQQVFQEWRQAELVQMAHPEEMRAYDAAIARAKAEAVQGTEAAAKTGLFGKLVGQKAAQERKAQEAQAKAKELEAEKMERDKAARKAATEAVKARLVTPQGREQFNADVAAKLAPEERRHEGRVLRQAEVQERAQERMQEKQLLSTMTRVEQLAYRRGKEQELTERGLSLKRGRDRGR